MRLSKDDYTDARRPSGWHAERRCTRPSRRRSLRSPNLKLSWLSLGIDSPQPSAVVTSPTRTDAVCRQFAKTSSDAHRRSGQILRGRASGRGSDRAEGLSTGLQIPQVSRAIAATQIEMKHGLLFLTTQQVGPLNLGRDDCAAHPNAEPPDRYVVLNRIARSVVNKCRGQAFRVRLQPQWQPVNPHLQLRLEGRTAARIGVRIEAAERVCRLESLASHAISVVRSRT
jgi:hypothetical protein